MPEANIRNLGEKRFQNQIIFQEIISVLEMFLYSQEQYGGYLITIPFLFNFVFYFILEYLLIENYVFLAVIGQLNAFLTSKIIIVRYLYMLCLPRNAFRQSQ